MDNEEYYSEMVTVRDLELINKVIDRRLSYLEDEVRRIKSDLYYAENRISRLESDLRNLDRGY